MHRLETRAHNKIKRQFMPTDSNPKATLQANAIKIAALFPLAAGLLAYLLHPPFYHNINEGISKLVQADIPGLRRWAESWGVWAAVATSLLMIIQALAAPIPAVFVTLTNSLLFGWVAGGILSIFSATIAAAICFILARTFGEPLVSRLLPERTRDKTNRFMQVHGAPAILAARLFPLVPFDPISYVAGLSQMRFWTFFWATFVGQIPAGMAYSYLGQEIGRPGEFAVLAVGAFLCLLVIGFAARRMLSPRPGPTE